MTRWDQDNFLERVMPLLTEKRPDDLCPRAAAVSAVLGEERDEVFQKAIAEHASGCPACIDLRRRIAALEAALPAHADEEWNRAAGRLDSWFPRV